MLVKGANNSQTKKTLADIPAWEKALLSLCTDNRKRYSIVCPTAGMQTCRLHMYEVLVCFESALMGVHVLYSMTACESASNGRLNHEGLHKPNT